MKRTKKIALIMLAVALMAVCFVFGASALDATGQCGDNVYWSFNENTGELVIYGEGDMWEVEKSNDLPFSESDITEVVIETGVTSIGSYTFDCCPKLEKVTIPDSVTYIGEFAFKECFNLDFITVDENNSAYSSDSRGVLFNKDKTVLIQYPIGNENIKYDIPESVEKIEVLAFFLALNLEQVTIPSNIKVVGYGAFQQCFNLTNITISKEVTNIDDTAFFGLPFLEKTIIKDMNVNLGMWSLGYTTMFVHDIPREEFKSLLTESIKSGNSLGDVDKYVDIYIDIFNEPIAIGTIYCHAGSTAEAYAIENGLDYELTHFFEGEWTYDYDNMIRTRKCIHCDELQVEELEIEEISGDNFLVVEETVTNGIEGDVEVLKAFDINLKNSEGVHVQPDGSIKVKLPNDWSKSGIYKVYRVNDDGTLTDMNAYREGSHLVFDTDHFSIYVIVFTPDETTEEEPDTPAEPDTSDCNCICHATGFLNRILAFVYKLIMKLFAMAPVCECGVAHY